ncbi:hypothetical protein NCS57_00883300 [Fusarium keratoplasticum]|uniref:Uncharacterized protein n=1 Tax=Fusarium keratoplasticum TaxID=1328300 RepID=A0ACC0QUS2_9HYPO|nr:hypothetical protein NCS57_00883300 [Fusarium keratoplasticum]KAI8666579.1 hypothetical protein NCS57_00883300 [Fusarium keratoplasticum]
MLPRKRARPNPAEAAQKVDSIAPVSASIVSATSQSQASEASSASEATSNSPMPPARQQTAGDSVASGQKKSKEVRKSKSWYGSWPRAPKASASTSVAKENIFGGTVKSSKTPDLSRFDSKKNDDTASVRSTAGTIKAMPKIPENKSDVTMTEENVPTEPPKQTSETEAPPKEQPKAPERPETPKAPQPSADTIEREAEPQPQPEPDDPSSQLSPQRPTTSSGWLGWWSRTPFTETQTISKPDEAIAPAADPETTKEAEEARPVTPPAQTAPPEVASPPSAQKVPSASWFGFWYSSAEPPKVTDDKPDAQPEPVPEAVSEDVTMTDAPPAPPHQHEPPPKAGSTWAFWSKESPKSTQKPTSPESGEMAVMGEGSEAHPRPMAECDVSPTKEPAKNAPKVKEAKSGWRKNKRGRPQSMDLDPPSPSLSGASTPRSATPQIHDMDKPSAVPAKVASSGQSIAESEASVKPTNNLLLPSFSSTYQMKENPSILKQLTQFLLRTQQAPANHVFRIRDPPKIHKAIAIGVHGLFPATYLRPMIGQPTGTSLRFAGLGAEAIRRWAEAHGCGDCEIEKVALEGEGKIRDRVDNLWKLMLNWIDHIRSADLVLIACHSQGVPVSIMLLEKLIDLGVITNAKVGVCAMAGVALGPFPDYKSGLLMGSAAELWEFGNPESDNSKRFENALKHVVDYGARITFIGSIDDQLVPMESAVYSPANHPYIYRAVFIDGRVHAPDFIAHLVGFALKLRNLGVSDHGLIRELSIPLAGSLYSGAGHSRLYYDDAVYDLAVSHALETASTGALPPPCTVSARQGPLTSANPYVLPWIMRGLLEEDFVRTELSNEADELLKQFDDWKPTNKALKDVKYRLEAVRSKL